jgi:hypothetical protein
VINRAPMTITSVEPLEGYEGTLVTLRGSGFAAHPRNNCVVVAGMGACARAEPGGTPNELRVRVGPVAKEVEGDILAWPGIGADLYTERIGVGKSDLQFSEAALFRNGAPVATAGITFRLTKVSPDTYAGYLEPSAPKDVDLKGLESGPAMRVAFPKGFELPRRKTFDLCLVLKEPTLAIDLTAEIEGEDAESCLRALAKSITANASLVGENVFADVLRNEETGGLDLYISKPYLTNGMVALRFGGEPPQAGRAKADSESNASRRRSAS